MSSQYPPSVMDPQQQPQFSIQRRDQVPPHPSQHSSPYTPNHSIFQEHLESQRYRQLQEQEEYKNLSSPLLKRDQFGREEAWDQGDSESSQKGVHSSLQTPKPAVFAPIKSSQTHEKLERLEQEASSVVEAIAKGHSDESKSSEIDLEYKRNRPYFEKARERSDSEFSLKGQLNASSRMQSLVSVPEDTQAKLQSDNSTSMSSALDARNMPRSSSIDSAASNTSSSHGHSHSSSSASTVSPAEIAQLIHAAGSAEAVIAHLLKDKSHVQAQNTQLWRLVDKQRAMILGLNRDLERALKDKERYRQKLREHLAMFPVANNGYPNDSRNAADSPAPSETMDGQSPQDMSNLETNSLSRANSLPLPGRDQVVERERNGSLEVPTTPYHVTASSAQQATQNVHTLLSEKPQENISLPTPQFNSVPATATPIVQPKVDRIDSSQHLRIQDVSYNQPLTRPLRSPLRSPRGPDLRLDVDTVSKSISRDGPSPLSLCPSTPLEKTKANEHKETKTPENEARPSTGKSERSTPRKGPPARLELERPRMPFEAKRGSPDNEESHDDGDDDDDDISVEEIAGYEQRMKEREMTSNTGKSYHEQSQELKGEGEQIVSGSRTETKAIIPEHLPDTMEQAQESIDSIIAPMSSTSKIFSVNRPAPLQLDKHKGFEIGGPRAPPGYQETIADRKPTMPFPLTPGLPSSPRPAPNSPLPRPRRDISSPEPLSPKSMPLSPRPGLPSSPRMGLTPGSFPHHAKGPGTPMRGVFPNGLGLLPLPSPNPLSGDRTPSRSGPNSNTSSQSIELLIKPSAISTIEAHIVFSRMKPSRASLLPGRPRNESQDSVFTLGVFSRSTGKEQWRVEKDVEALTALDSRLRQCNKDLIAELPERSLFTGHAPARVDARRSAIDVYFSAIMSSSLGERGAQVLSEFFSADVVDGTIGISHMISASEGGDSPEESPVTKGTKEGYLTKRGKNFGGWKSRYFVLDGPVLRYYETPGGDHLGSIKLQNAQIGRQSESKNHSSGATSNDLLAEENQYRHAFLILEPKRKDSNSVVRHVLCAENDAERDEWVDALMQWVDKVGDESSSQKSHKDTGKRKKRKEKDQNDKPNGDLRAISYEDATPGAAPARGPSPEELGHRTPTPTSSNSSTLLPSYSSSIPASSPLPDRQPMSKQISGPVGGSVISDASAWGNKTDKEAKSLKKRSIWGFRGRTSSEMEVAQKPISASRMVFGVSLEEALSVSRPFGAVTPLPAVVYRCLEYLDAKNAIHEEGIFRLSGSSAVIKALRDRFNSEIDVNLLASDEYYDVHAVAGLLKLYLRELPTNILTTEKREDFLRVTEMEDRVKKIAELNRLVHNLPAENFALLKALSGHLICIVENANINKMTVRNVGIVFSPTLNIPAQIFSLFLQEYHGIFSENQSEGGNEYCNEHNIISEAAYHLQPRKPSISASSYDQSRSDSVTLPSHLSHITDQSAPPPYDQPSYQPQDQLANSQHLVQDTCEAVDQRQYLQQQQQQESNQAQQQMMQLQLQQQQQQQQRQHLQPDPYPQLHGQGSRESLNSHNSDSSKSTKAKRRESSMLSVMGMGGMRKSILPHRHHQPTIGMVTEDSLYD